MKNTGVLIRDVFLRALDGCVIYNLVQTGLVWSENGNLRSRVLNSIHNLSSNPVSTAETSRTEEMRHTCVNPLSASNG
jgi:hypothetical protein